MTSRHAGLVLALLACVCLIAGMCGECWAPPSPVQASMPEHDCCPKPQPAKSTCQANPTDLLSADPNHPAPQLGPELAVVALAASLEPQIPVVPVLPVAFFDSSPPPLFLQTAALLL